MIACVKVCVAPSFLPPTAPTPATSCLHHPSQKEGKARCDCLSVFYLENLFSFSSLNPETVLVWEHWVQSMKKLRRQSWYRCCHCWRAGLQETSQEQLLWNSCIPGYSLEIFVYLGGIHRIVTRYLWMSSLNISTNVLLYLDNTFLLNSFNVMFPCGLFSNPDKENNAGWKKTLFLSVCV